MFKNPFSFEGRIRRTEYGLSLIIYYVAALIASMLTFLGDVGIFLCILSFIPCIWFLFAQGAKRCHDRGNSGFYMLIPFYGIWMLYAEGDSTPNEYGPNPKNKYNVESYTGINA